MFWTHLIPGTRGGDDADALRNNIGVHELPRGTVFMASAIHILGRDLGFLQSAETNVATLGNAEPIPMMSYGFVEYVMGLDLMGLDCLELGGGRSTQFWARRVARLVTLETDADVARRLLVGKPANVEVAHVEAVRLPEAAARSGVFDAVVIDAAANRVACARAALKILKPGGFVVLDNSDWFPNAARVLRDGNLIQVDFHDFRPAHHYRCATSIFLHHDFRPKPRAERLPLQPVGGKTPIEPNGWDSL